MRKLRGQEIRKTLKLRYDSICWALNRFQYNFEVALDLDEYKRLILNSNTSSGELTYNQYPTMEQVLEEIAHFPEFFSKQSDDGGLNGQRVKYYLWINELKDA